MAKEEFFGRFGDMLGKGARSLRDRFVMDVTDLIRAVGHNDVEETDRSLRAGIDPDQADVLERRALTMAVDNNNLEIVRMLLAAGADPNLPGRDGQSPLSKAVFWEHGGIIKALIMAGGDPNLSINGNPSPMEAAQKAGHLQLIEFLQTQKRNKRAKQVKKDQARHEALKKKAQYMREKKAEEIRAQQEAEAKRIAEERRKAKKELEQMALRNYKGENEDDLTAYIRAIRQKDSAAAMVFLERIVDLNASHQQLKTSPLLEAVREGDQELIQFLMDREVDAIHPVEGTNHSPLSMAVKKKEYALVEHILEQNEASVVDILNDPEQLMSLQYFAYKDPKMLDLLLTAGADPYFGGKGLPSPVARAIEKASIAILPVLVKNGVDLNKDYQGKRPLEIAIENNNTPWVIGLLAEGADTKFHTKEGLSLVELAEKSKADRAISNALKAH